MARGRRCRGRRGPARRRGSPRASSSTLGHRFLARLYRRMRDRRPHRCSSSTTRDGVAGFVAAAADTRPLLQGIPPPRRHRRPARGRRRRAAPRHRARCGRRCATAPAATTTISRRRRSSPSPSPTRVGRPGIGGRLVAPRSTEFRERAITVGARRHGGRATKPRSRMYERAGFRRYRRTEVHAGIAQEVLVWP